jgi:hypothetical protein
MIDTELDRLLRSADPAAGLSAPTPAPFREQVVPLRPRPNRWLPAAAAAAAVVAVVGLAVVTLGSKDGGTQAAGPGPTGAPASTATAAPGGLTDSAKKVQAAVVANLPPGYQLSNSAWKVPPPTSPRKNGREYDATFLVREGPRSAPVEIIFQTDMPPGDLCALASKFVGAGTCRLVRTATGARVAVAEPGSTRQRALYRHPDGTIVLVAEGSGVVKLRGPSLTHPIWSAARLAEVATDPAFRR